MLAPFGIIVTIESGENNEGEDRLRFYLKDGNNNDSKPDSIALTVKDGQQRIVIDASNIDAIELSQKSGTFNFKMDGTYKVHIQSMLLFVIGDPLAKDNVIGERLNECF